MRPSRSTRLLTAILTVISLLFTQLALAAYVCPASVPASVAQVQARACDRIDATQPTLCAAHAHTVEQSSAKTDLPQIPAFAAVGPVLGLALPAPLPAPLAQIRPPALGHATAPPLAIRHCCFRI